MKATKERMGRLEYCQYLLVSQNNYTLTNYAEHSEKFSHDMANRYLAGDEIRSRLVWENVKEQVDPTPSRFPPLGATSVNQISVSTASIWQKNGRMSAKG